MDFERRENRKEITPLDQVARRGHFKKGDLPGTDTYDDGMDERGRIRPGSTTTESGGNYMEDHGPMDLLRRGSTQDDARAAQSGLNISEHPEEALDKDTENDAAAKWLRENDPELKGKKKP